MGLPQSILGNIWDNSLQNKSDNLVDDSERDTVFVQNGELSVDSMPLLNQKLDEAQHADPFVGMTLDGKYEILQNVGQGGMSIVYKAMQTAMNRIVALKMLKMGLSADPIFSQRFMREVSLLGKLNHPNIVTVFDSGKTEQGNLYLAMDYLSGPTLQEIIDKDGALPIERAGPIIMQVCDALNHAHKRDIIHRDLKPGNIMIESGHRGEDIVKIVDFGLAKMGEGSERLTRAGELWGSSFYMSPEQCNGSKSDARSDIYSFGIVIYQLLAGKVPFRGSGFMDTVSKQMNETPPPLRATKSDLEVPDMLERVIFKCLEKSPENRFQSVSELKSAMQAAIPEVPKVDKRVSGSMPKPVEKTKRRSDDKTKKDEVKSNSSALNGLIVIGIVLIVCALVVCFVLSNQKPDGSKKSQKAAPNTVAPAANTLTPAVKGSSDYPIFHRDPEEEKSEAATRAALESKIQGNLKSDNKGKTLPSSEESAASKNTATAKPAAAKPKRKKPAFVPFEIETGSGKAAPDDNSRIGL